MAYDVCARHVGLDEVDLAMLELAAREGRVRAEIYTAGTFNEAGFVRFGRLNALEGDGYVSLIGLTGAPDHGTGDARYDFALTERGRASAPMRLAAGG
jgi:hypothetical protein